MTALMSKATRGLWTLAGLVLVAGAGVFVYRHSALGPEHTLKAGAQYLQDALSPLVLLSAALALVLGVAGTAVATYARNAPPPLAKRPALSPLEG
jgi:hypothetical protein